MLRRKIEAMTLQDRINAAAEYAIQTKRSAGVRAWRGEMAKAAGCSYQNISQLSRGLQQSMDASQLHKIAAWAGVDHDWLIFGTGEMAPRDRKSETPTSTVFPSSDIKQNAAPVIEWARLGVDLYKDNDDWPAEGRRIIATGKAVSNKVKWLEVKDDTLAPKVQTGDMVAVDPAGTPRMDGLVLAKAADGTYILRFWRPLAGGKFELFDGSGRTMDSDRHGLEVAAAFVCLQRDNI